MCVHLPFKHKKATQALNFFANRTGGTINKLRALKLIFLAERYHLRKFGRPITNDEFYAMKLGPVASSVKDIAEHSEFLGPEEKEYAEQFVQPEGHDYHSLEAVNERVFSRSDIEALTFAWERFGGVEEFDLSEITHEYPEWKKYEEALKNASRMKMDYEDFFNDPADGVEKCFELTAEQKQIRIESLKESSKLEKAWNY